MKILCLFGKHNYGSSERGLGYEYSNFVPALKNLGHEVVFFESLNKSCYSDFTELNRELLKTVERESPDIIFCVLMTYEIWLETLELIRGGSKAALIHWATDDSWKYDQLSRFYLPYFDLHVTTYPSAVEKARADGFDHVLLSQWAASSERLRPPLPAQECKYDVTFVGSCYGTRPQWIRKLKERGLDVRTFGYGWPSGAVKSENIPEIMRQSRISLNFADSGLIVDGLKIRRDRQIKARTFEVPGCGGMLLTEMTDRIDDFYLPDKEIAVFRDIDELAEKIQWLLGHPEERDAIAQAGYERTEREHTYEHRFRQVLDEALVRRKARMRRSAAIDFRTFEKAASRHKPGFFLKTLRLALLLPCVLVWGKDRGGRAARRILYELGWRLVGDKVYSSAGWPGRIFYRES